MLNDEGFRRSAFGLILGCALLTAASGPQPASSLTWNDLPSAAQAKLRAAGVSQTGFPDYLARLHQVHAQRVREGDLDHLVFYLLQSTHFTRQPPIEPALSARALVDSLGERERAVYLRQGNGDVSRAARYRLVVDTLTPLPSRAA